ncbi:hypothetical protein HH310_42130 [Actinoplanes sp. TBRC 11911]|uniref:hypothetical protein n=1 Tax=Actinoplanes sp. TBRC 11911 TaxID=2729386 RepID=UPI00145F0695|nr:hypothetical protein [Actinoplanes sp. TBRC 11911]NMO57750.1 hypothetical protein [Actinoplanes sp. TBRC 11911]
MDEPRSLVAGGVGQFLRRWYGLVPAASSGAVPVGFAVPSELADWHAVTARATVPVTFQDHPIAFADLSPDPDGMLTFWVENQHGYFWAVDLKDPQRRVFCREVASDEWEPAGEDLRRFLLHGTLREAIFGADKKFTVFVDDSLVDDALESFSVLDFPALAGEEPGTKIWSSVDALARVGAPPAGYDRPGEQLQMITIAVPNDTSIETYGSRFGLEISDEAVTLPVEIPYEPPPF